MGTPNSSTDFLVADLIGRGWTEDREPEERALIEKASVVVREIVAQLRPILRYVSEEVLVSTDPDGPCKSQRAQCIPGIPVGTRWLRAIEVFELRAEPREVLFLAEGGVFFVARLCMSSHSRHFHEAWREGERWTWQLAPFAALLQTLRDKLGEAEDRREKHLASIRERSKMLDRVLAVIKRAENA